MTQKLVTRISILALVFMLAALPAAANQAPSVANVQIDAAGLYFQPQVSYGQLVLTVTGPRDFQQRATFNAGEYPAFELGHGMADGTYNYELRVIPAIDQETHDMLSAAREAGEEGVTQRLINAGLIPETTLVQSGAFTIAGGLVVDSGVLENVETKAIPTKATVLATNDGVIRFSLCVGGDCPNSPSFGADTLRLQENNTRIHFNDTSNSGSFPTNDWRITANDSTNGGDNYLAIDDVDGGRTPFRVDAGAPSNSLRVSSSGNIGIGTGSPGSLEVHVVDGDSPTLRLEQDGSSGFTPQTYDIASNEANFFIRDVTNGSKLFFRSKPGAPENSLFIAANGDVGLGTDSPTADLHVRRTSGATTLDLETTASEAVQFNMINNGGEWQVIHGAGGGLNINRVGVSGNQFIFTTNGNLTLQGSLIAQGGDGTTDPGDTFPDYVFEPDYELMTIDELRNFVIDNKHLPRVMSRAEVSQAGGVNMTELQLQMLEKIEELTLYTLEQHDTIQALKDKVRTLEEGQE